MIAANAGHVEAFNALLKRGAALDETDEDGKTIVHLAAESNHVAILRVQLITYVDAYIHTYNTYSHALHTYM